MHAPLISKRAGAMGDAYASITPRDEYNAAYLSFVLMGVGFLLPWNACITAVGYFSTLFNNPNIDFYYSIAYMCPNLFGLVFVVNWGHRVSFFKRINTGFVIFLAILVAMPFIKNMTTSVGLVGVLGFADAVVQGSIYGLAGQFHPRYVGAVMAGNGVAGVSVCALRIITKAVVPASFKDADLLSTGIYFGLAGLVTILCIVVYSCVLERSKVTKFYLAKTEEERMQYITKLTRAGQNVSTMGSNAYVSSRATSADVAATAADYGLSLADDAPGADAADAAMAGATSRDDDASIGVVQGGELMQSGVWSVFVQVWPMAFVAATNFLVTLALFPGLTSQMNSPNFSTKVGWYPVILITLFNVFDLVGRTSPKWDSLIFIGPKWLWVPTVLRVGFIPLFVMSLHHIVFTDDFWMYAFMSLMALSNGYLGTLAMMYGPARVGVADKERAGSVMVFFLTTGLTSGVWMGLLFNKLFGIGGTLIHGGHTY